MSKNSVFSILFLCLLSSFAIPNIFQINSFHLDENFSELAIERGSGRDRETQSKS